MVDRDGVFGFGILNGSLLQKAKPKIVTEEITSFAVETVSEARMVAGQLNNIAKSKMKITDYRSYLAGDVGSLRIPSREATKESWVTERKEGEPIPGATVLIPGTKTKPFSPKTTVVTGPERWVIQIYTKLKPGGFKYMQEPAVTFIVREYVYHTPEGGVSMEPSKIKGHPYTQMHQHGKIDAFFRAVRSGDYEFVRAYNYQNSVNLVKVKR